MSSRRAPTRRLAARLAAKSARRTTVSARGASASFRLLESRLGKLLAELDHCGRFAAMKTCAGGMSKTCDSDARTRLLSRRFAIQRRRLPESIGAMPAAAAAAIAALAMILLGEDATTRRVEIVIDSMHERARGHRRPKRTCKARTPAIRMAAGVRTG